MSRKLTKLMLVAVLTVVLFALASFNAFAAKSYTSDGADMDSLIATALSDAASEDVTITLNGTWTFTDECVFGDPESIPSNTITITGGTIATDGNMRSFCGNFKFENVNFVGAKSARYASRGDADAANGLYFPEGASCVIGTGCTGSKNGRGETIGVNLAGDSIEVNSGEFYIICAQIYGNLADNVTPINDPKITFQGDADAYTVCGGGYNVGNVTGKVDLKVKGTPTITGFLCGGYYSASTNIGGTIDVDTEGGTINLICASAGTSGLGSSSNVGEYTINVKSSSELAVTGVCAIVLNGDGSISYLNTTINLYSGVKMASTNWFNVRSGTNGSTGRMINSRGKTVVNFYGGTYAGTMYGGSGLYKDGGVDGTDLEMNIYDGAFQMFAGGGTLNAANTKATGKVTVRVNHWTSSGNNKYGGWLVYGDGADAQGEVNVYMGNPAYDGLTGYVAMYAAGYNNSATGIISGNSTLTVDNVNGYTGRLVAGAWLAKQGAVYTGDSTLHVISGTVSGSAGNVITGGCYADNLTGVPDDTDPDDYITGGFGHIGNVKVVIDGGTFKTRTSFTSHGVNVKGNSTLIFNGGTFNEYSANGTWYRFSLLSDQAPAVDSNYNVTSFNTCSISGDLKVYFTGGNYILGAFRFAELSASPNNTQGKVPHTGYGVVGGNTYMEIAGGTWSENARPYVNNHGNTIGDCYLKFVGHNFTMSTKDQFYGINDWGQTWQTPVHGKYYLDLSLVDSEGYSRFISGTNTTATGNGSVFTAVYPALYDLDTISASNVDLGAGASPLTGSTLTTTFTNEVVHSGSVKTSSYTREWADVEKWDEYALNKTADAFEFTSGGNTVTEVSKFFTGDIEMTVAGKNQTLTGTNNEIAAVETATQAEFGYLGVSVRPSDNGLRARAYVLDSLRGRTLAADGYKAVEYGVLVSKTATGDLVLGGAKTTKAMAFGGSTDKYFVEDGKYTFAATVTNIKAANYDTQLIFRPYIVLEDEAGIQITVYADMTGVTNFVDGNNVKASLREVATFVRDNQVDFYTQNKSKIDAIIAG